MGFSLSDLNPKKVVKNFHSSSMNLARNPFDKDALKNWQASMHPGLVKTGSAAAQGGEVPAAEPVDPYFQPTQFVAPQPYPSFASLFNQPQYNYSSVSDVYQRGFMPNNLLARYNSLASNLQAQQGAMVPRPQAPTAQQPRTFPKDNSTLGAWSGSPYVNFSQLFRS